MNKIYNRINWKNNTTPINATNLNKMDAAIDGLDSLIIALDDDLRVGADGKVYTNACDAIRSQLSDLLTTIHDMLVTIREQPEDATIDIDGGPAIFTVDAVGIDLSYQWQYLTSAASTWKNCSAATAGYNTNSIQVAARAGSSTRDGYKYRCVVTDNIKGYTETSSEATLTVTVGSMEA